MKPESIKFARVTIKEANQKLLFQLYHDYDDREAANIVDWLMENLTDWKKIDRIINNKVALSLQQLSELDRFTMEIGQHKPVQYILNEAWFCGLKLYVDENVLIPRPETEELVEWIASETKNKELTLLDIGTGSGCIALGVKKLSPGLSVSACDISINAIEVAKKNAASYDADINFFQTDILNRDQWNSLSEVNIIVSNPPYIPEQEKQTMNKNVVQYEPATALFVNDNDPLIFYKTIAIFGKEKLIEGGTIYVEIHENLSAETALVFQSAGYKNIEIRKDMQGRQRMIKAY